MYISLAMEMGIGSVGSVCFNRESLVSLKAGVQCHYFVHLLHKTEDKFLDKLQKNLHVLLYDSKLSSSLHSPHLSLSKCCPGLSLSSQAFLLLHPQLPYKQQPDLVCAVLVLMERCIAQVSNANPLFVGQWNGCHDIYTTWNAVLYRS